jgi:DNA-binding NarL/FixJ family response regulator
VSLRGLKHQASSTAATRILLVDDHGIVRDGLSLLLERQGDIEVVGTAATGRSAVIAAQRLVPDLIIMDLVLPDLSGIDATVHILRALPLTHVIVMSASNTCEHVYQALRAGARGYVVKQGPAIELVQAVRAVLAGGQYLSSGITAFLAGGLVGESAARSPMERLSLREREVLHRTVAGASSAAIAQHLSLSPKTVDTYRNRLMAKLGVANRSALIRFAIEHGLTPV